MDQVIPAALTESNKENKFSKHNVKMPHLLLSGITDGVNVSLVSP
jgi:hypothetical protein